MIPKVGYSYRVAYSKGNPNNYTFHVRGIVDGQYVIAHWHKRWKGWVYDVKSPIYFEITPLLSRGKTKLAGNDTQR